MLIGDVIESITKRTGIAYLVKRFYPDCGCEERKNWTNEIHLSFVLPPVLVEYTDGTLNFHKFKLMKNKKAHRIVGLTSHPLVPS